MKKLSLYVFPGLLWGNVGYAGEKLNYDWFKVNNKFTNANELIHKKNFINFIGDNISSKKLSLGRINLLR